VNPARFPAVLYVDAGCTVALVVDCAGPRCMSGVQEILVHVAGLSADDRAARLRDAASSRALCTGCTLHAGYVASTKR
jgi:hypothetical protein